MRAELTASQRTELAAAAAAEPRVRRWKRFQARAAAGRRPAPAAVAQSLGCSRASVYAWAAAWRQDGVAGLREGDARRRTGQAGRGWRRRAAAPAGDRSPSARPSGHGVDRAVAAGANWRRSGMRSGHARSAGPCIGWAIAGNGRSMCWDVPIRPTPKKGGRDRAGDGHAGRGWGGLGGRRDGACASSRPCGPAGASGAHRRWC